MAGAACVGLIGPTREPRPLLALALAGSALMAHDWHDRSLWFERGHGSQT